MADKRITELAPLDAAGAQGAVDVLAVADVSAAETKKITLGAAVAAGLAGGVPDGSISGDKIESDSISGDRLLENSITSRELAPDSVGTVHVIDGAITNAKLAAEISGDKLQDGSVGHGQIGPREIEGRYHIQLQSVTADEIANNTIGADQISINAIGSSELADGAVDTSAILDNAISTSKYQNASVTNEKLAAGIDGSKILDGSINAGKLEPGTISGDQLDSVPLDKLPDAPANNVLAGPASGGTAATPAYRSLVADDLPTASTTAKGAVSVPADGGLSITGSGVGITNTVAPGGNPFVNYDKHGSITSSRPLSGSDLPPPVAGNPGAVKPGDGLEVTGDGTLNVIPATDSAIGGVIASDGITIAPDGKISQSVTGVAAGQYTKITVDEMGSVTAGEQLVASDIPNINWDQINDPSVDGTMLTDKSVQRRHMADYSTMYIQEVAPTVDSTVYVGTMWFKESTASLAAWNGNSFMSIGQGRLSAENLRYSGIFNASTGLITGLTQFGVGEGYEIGTAIPVATDEQTGVYFVAQVPGDGTAVTPGISYDAGDWLLCNGAAAGWVRIDTMSSGGGGGGGAANLSDLLDVSIASATTGALLQLQASGQWADCYAIDGGDY